MKKLLFTFALCLACFHLSAQEWVVRYVGEHLPGHTTFVDGFIDEDGVTFLAGREDVEEGLSDALLMRIEPDGAHTEFRYDREGYHSRATCILEMRNHNLFVAGNLSDDSDDYIMVLIFDKHLNLLVERQYEKEVEAVSFRSCQATLDSHEHVIVSTAVVQDNQYQGQDYRGVFFKFNYQGELVSHRYLIEEYPDPLFYFMDFRLRQMWYKDDETLFCLCTGYGGVLSFVTFDSAFNYIEEHPIWRSELDKFEHSINRDDGYTDYWYNEDEALFFSSIGDYERNKLRVSRVNTHGEFLDFICLNERTDTIDDAASSRCMAAVNDTTFYFLFHYHVPVLYPGTGCVYQLNDRLEIVGRHLDDEHQSYQSRIILPSSDNGCVVVYDSCAYKFMTRTKHPVIKKLSPNDFEQVFLSVEATTDNTAELTMPYPNPADDVIHIPLPEKEATHRRIRISDTKGLVVVDRIVEQDASLIRLDISGLKPGLYQYTLYTPETTLLTKKFIKK